MHSLAAPVSLLASLLFAAACSAFYGCAAEPPAPPTPATTIIITRHAEKAAGSPDPDLSPAGRERAQALATRLASYQVTTTLTTLTRRAIQTAEPTIAARRIPDARVLRVPPATSAAALAEIIRARPAGECILVVSHSNVIPELLKALGVPGTFTMSESDYGRVFIVRLSGDRPTLERDKLLDASQVPENR